MASWNYDWFPLPGQAVFDRAHQHVTVVSRAPGNLDLFIVGNDNHVWTTWWNDKAGWAQDWFPLPGQAVFDHTIQQVAAVSRAPGNLDLFIVGNDNHVWTTWWNAQNGWARDWSPLPGHAVFDRTTQQVAAVSRAAGNLDLFIVGNDNHVWTTWWNAQAGWSHDWFPTPGQAVFDRVNQKVTAVSRASGNLDLFIVGNDNHVWTTWWNAQAGWSHDWFPTPGQAVFDRQHQHVAAVARASGNLDLFIVGNDNDVWSSYWNSQSGWSRDWFPLPGRAVFDRTVQQVAATTRASGNLDLFIVGNDNHIWTSWWNSQGGWSSDWFPLPSEAVFDRTTQRVAAVARTGANLDLFIVGNENHVWSTYWSPADVKLAKLIDNGSYGSKITMVVVGDGFTAWDQDNFNRHVDDLLINGLFTHDFYAANKSAFNVVRLNVLSNQSGVSTKTYNANGTVTTVTHDTYFGAIFNGDWGHCWVEDGPNTASKLNTLLNQYVPDRKLTFLLLNNPGFGGCGGGGRLTLPLGVSWSTVAHECGHALGGLADEYHQANNAYTGGEPGQPNATINTNRATLKWRSFVASSTPLPTGDAAYTPPKPTTWNDNQSVGLFQGGSANFATGIYRPVLSCRMNSNDPPFCPVCNKAMSDQAHPYLKSTPTAPTGVPLMSTTDAANPTEGYMRLQVHLQDGVLSVPEAHEVEGPLVQPETVTSGLVSEVLVDNQRVAVGNHPEAGISRSFEEPGHGQGGHRILPRQVADLTVRVPTAALRGVDPSKVTISVHNVQEHPAVSLAPLLRLSEQPQLKLDPAISSSVSLDQVALPGALQSVLESK